MNKILIPALFCCWTIFFCHDVRAEELLTWKDCVAEAKKNHPDLVSAQEKLNQVKAQYGITSSNLLPQITGSVSAKASGEKTRGTGSSGSITTRSDDYSYGISGKQLLFDGFKTYFDTAAASKDIESSERNYDITSSNVRLRLRTAFIGLLKAQELIHITEDIVKRRKQSRDLVQLRYNSGSENRGSLLTAEANLAQANFEVAQATRNLDLAERTLSKELGRRKFTSIRANGEFNVPDKETAEPDLEKLADLTPSFRQLVVQKESARFSVSSAEASFFPEISATASMDKDLAVWPPRNDEWSAGIAVSVPIFEGTSLGSGLFKAESAFHQAKADEESGRDGIIVSLEAAWTQFEDGIEEVDVQKKFLDADEERAKIAEAQYSTGLITFNDWIIIEDNLVSTQKTYLSAEATALLAEAGWVQVKGETLDTA